MKVAIVGAGFSGLAVCWHLLQKMPNYKVTIYAPEGIHGGSSGIAAGLLHPYVGAQARLNWQGHEGMEATRHLLRVAETALGKPVAQKRGFLRIALNESQIEDYQRCVAVVDNPLEVEWYSAEHCQQFLPGLVWAPGMMTHTGIAVYTVPYLEGLKRACESLGAIFKESAVKSLDSLKEYDVVIVATGASIKEFPEFSHLAVRSVKGQLLELAWPSGLAPLPCPINAQAYIVMSQDQNSCFVGSTYEKGVLSAEPDVEVAKRLILPKVRALLPALAEAEVIGCRAGMRATTEDRHPLIGCVDGRWWYITGMGSRGLLYHALMAEQLVEKISLFFHSRKKKRDL
jgi:glycine/D-amino acid oxidase-like deaminating enzyme